MRKRIFMVILISILCMSAQAGIGDYFKDRGADIMDIFLLRVSVARKARAFGFRARATSLLQAGGIYFEGEHFGMDRRALGVMKERRAEGGISLLYYSSVRSEPVWGNYFMLPETPWMLFEERGILRNDVQWNDGRNHFFSFNAEVQPGLLPGLEAGIYPTEILDFVGGIFTLDPMNDDMTRVREYSPLYQPVIMDEEEWEEWEELPEDVDVLLESSETMPPVAPPEGMDEQDYMEQTQEKETRENETKPGSETQQKEEKSTTTMPEAKKSESGKKSGGHPEAKPARLVTRSKDEDK